MATSKPTLSNFLAKKGDGPKGVLSTFGAKASSKALSEQLDQRTRELRLKEAEAARVLVPTRLEHTQESKQRQLGKTKSSNAVPQARESDIVKVKEECSHGRSGRSASQDRYDATDLSDFDQTIVMSELGQGFDNSPRTEREESLATSKAHSLFARTTRASTNYDRLLDVSGHQGRDEGAAPRYGDGNFEANRAIEINPDEYEEEEDGSDADVDDGLKEDDPTLDSKGMNLVLNNYIKPDEIGDFEAFKAHLDMGGLTSGLNLNTLSGAKQSSYPSTELSNEDEGRAQEQSSESLISDDEATALPMPTTRFTGQNKQSAKAFRATLSPHRSNRVSEIPLGQPRPQPKEPVESSNLETPRLKRRHEPKHVTKHHVSEPVIQEISSDPPVHQSRSTQTPQPAALRDQTPKASELQNPDTSLNSTNATWGNNSPPHTPTSSSQARVPSPIRDEVPLLILDYDASQLSTMQFSTLQSQPFHTDPRALTTSPPANFASATLADRLKSLCPLPSNTSDETPTPLKIDAARLSVFFSTLPIEEYEEAGDYLLEGFENLIKRFKEARQEKRRSAVEFEKEIAVREAVVSRRKEIVEGGLKRLRRAGEGLIRGGG